MVAGSLSPVHEASLIDPSLHSPAMLELLDVKMSRTLIEYAVDCVVETVDYAMGRPTTSSRGRSMSRQKDHSKFSQFVSNVLYKAEVQLPVLLVSLVYIDRAKPHLQIALEQWACERVFLGALIAANKYCNDSTLKNVHWAMCTGVFGKRDVGRIEREFLDVLDYELAIHESDILSHHDAIMSLSAPSHHVHRHHHRSHAVSVPAQQAKHTAASRWSSDSDTDLDSESSTSSSSSPRTPEAESVSPAYVRQPSPEEAHHAPYVIVRPSAPASHTSKPVTTDVRAQAAPSQTRLSSALQLLRSISIPHFHSSSSSASSTPSSTSSASSSACKPALPSSRPAQVMV